MFNNSVKIAIAGIGTVGKGVVSLLKKNSFFKNLDFEIEITAIASRKKITNIGPQLKKAKFFSNAESLINFNNYDILIELIGGEGGVAKKIIFDALKKKKHVVTANKALVSKYWSELRKLSIKNNCTIKYEAAVAGGIPIIKTINDFLPSNKIKRIYGILNGTSNYILTNMLKTNDKFEKILLNAQKLGYAEADPSFDINGTDTAHKLAILSSLSFNMTMKLKNIYFEGIKDIDLVDLKYSDSLGYKIKLLGIAEKKKDKILSFVFPCLIDKKALISNIDDVYNGIMVETDFCEKNFFQGQGAGSKPTATSVVSDLLSIIRNKDGLALLSIKENKFKFIDIDQRVGCYYLRLTTLDKPGVISGISNEFKKNNISMKSMLQKDTYSNNKGHATIIITTHNCKEKDMMNALRKINKFKFVLKKTVFLRIENLTN